MIKVTEIVICAGYTLHRDHAGMGELGLGSSVHVQMCT